MRYWMLLLGLLATSWTQAGMHVCRDADGNTVFQDQPCGTVNTNSAQSQNVCSDSISAYQKRIQAGHSLPTDRTCLKQLMVEQQESERLAAEDAKRQQQLVIEKERQALQEERRKEQLAKAKEDEARFLAALKAAQNKIVESDDPELTKVMLERSCLQHVLDTHSFKDPDSVRIEGVKYAWLANGSLPRYAILLDVNAKNSWGAYVGAEQYRCYLSEDGQRLSGAQ
ncbi:DUF4124 domain-containing protein [Oceanobacter mangrovi]|uniref:DUF4124 domain-containing protein n=1 Tax=Oceanobacter mangrovi TaxID=2862510 RepID=UPI001C8EABA8|nr:DUF4124 domain-containing protein [Oceanobacter mangrovi]